MALIAGIGINAAQTDVDCKGVYKGVVVYAVMALALHGLAARQPGYGAKTLQGKAGMFRSIQKDMIPASNAQIH